MQGSVWVWAEQMRAGSKIKAPSCKELPDIYQVLSYSMTRDIYQVLPYLVNSKAQLLGNFEIHWVRQ